MSCRSTVKQGCTPSAGGSGTQLTCSGNQVLDETCASPDVAECVGGSSFSYANCCDGK